MAAVIEGQDKVLRRKLPRASGMSAELLRKIKQKYDKGERERQRQRERETKTANTDSQRSGSTRVIIVHKYTGPLRRPDVLKTPPSQDSRCDKTTGVTSKVVCPGTTIISPQGLLQRHENLQRNVERHWHPQEPQQEPMESSQGQEGMDWVFDDDSKMSESQRTPLPACLPSVSQCPKSVVINPLKYLEYFADSPWDTDKGTHTKGAHIPETHTCRPHIP
ncbi:hypothetical protein E2C01_017253 [Portunus trituberculatus]|uniref:Uncharacterized protein n=1 Tax=Portunus trituberculatus TaxID=210409 RepID=A0A5B7DSU7_PORTR|nr:hypothetical protein [Portunus trituberculatus]